MTLYPTGNLNKKQREVRSLALQDFEAFIRLVAPYQLLGHCHIDLCNWVRRSEEENKLILWPRDHGKSRMAAFYAAWQVIKDPSVTIIYASATAEKAEEQLRFIKDILTSEICFRYFPGLINPKEGHRTSWNITSIIIDHPYRQQQGVVDATIMTCGLDKTITGKHCKVFIWDDIVVRENNTENGRKDVNNWVAYAASILSADSHVYAIGTRYHPNDAYSLMIAMVYDQEFDEDGEPVGDATSLFMVNQADVELDGQFLWPQQERKDGRKFGFNQRILARKRAVYEAAGHLTDFYAQYYNDPNDRSTAPISWDLFNYYNKSDLDFFSDQWYIDNEPLHIYAALDMATTIDDRTDFTALVIGGIDRLGNRYLLDVIRYRTDKISKTLDVLVKKYVKWKFKALRIEAVSGFKLVAQDLADDLKEKGIRIPVDLYIPPNTDAKIVRVNNILEPLYQAGAMYHYKGGDAQILEEELCSVSPAHDDLKDAWSMCIDLMKPPIKRKQRHSNVINYHPRFGGVAV